MSGHRKFSELTKHFTPEDRKIIEAQKSEMSAAVEVEPEPTQGGRVTQQVTSVGKAAVGQMHSPNRSPDD